MNFLFHNVTSARIVESRLGFGGTTGYATATLHVEGLGFFSDLQLFGAMNHPFENKELFSVGETPVQIREGGVTSNLHGVDSIKAERVFYTSDTCRAATWLRLDIKTNEGILTIQLYPAHEAKSWNIEREFTCLTGELVPQPATVEAVAV